MRKHQTRTHLRRHIAILASLALASLSAMAASTSALTDSAADTAATSTALVAFAQCDASFFKLLGKSPSLLGPGVDIAVNGSAASPKVADPLSEIGRVQIFAKPINVAGLRLLAWRNEVSYDTTMGAFLWWGFETEGTTDTVAAAVNRLLEPAQRVQKSPDGNWARAESRRIGDRLDQWRRGGEAGVVTAKGTVERVLLIEAHDTPGRTKLYCALQGSVTPPLLDHVRPDLPTSLHP